MLTRSRTLLVWTSLAALTLVGACDDDPAATVEITRQDIIRTFTAERMTARIGGVTTDLLAQGATLTITLHQDGTTTGRFFFPGGAEGGGDLDADLAGTFTFNEDTNQVTFEQTAHTLVRDITFTAVRSGGGVKLEGQDTFSGVTVIVVLS